VSGAVDASGEALADLARSALEIARRNGANESAATITRAREVQLRWRDGRLDQLGDATTRTLALRLFVAGRYSNVSTSDLRPQALDVFIRNAIALTRKLGIDPFRTLPDPRLYDHQAKVDLALFDGGGYERLTVIDRRRWAQGIEAAARAAEGAAAIVSVTARFDDVLTISHQVHSNGFEGSSRQTRFGAGATVCMKDTDGRRPTESSYASVRFLGELPGAAALGSEATRRTAGRLGARKLRSEVLPMVVDGRDAVRLVEALTGALSGRALQQKESFLQGKHGTAIGNARLEFADDPLVTKGLASRIFDGEGLAARPLPIVRAGILEGSYLDTYYARKLGTAPTTGRPSNLAWKLGDKDGAALMADVKEGVLVTGFLGGDSNPLTGDFSLGIAGRRIRSGEMAEPVAEMIVSGNHLDLWRRLAAVGNDPYPYASFRTPTLVFDSVQFAGT
jgi:PmbA protein